MPAQRLHDPLENVPAEGAPYFTPAQLPPSGTALKSDKNATLPKVFEPISIRSLTLQNRIVVSPMCQYSAVNGHFTPWHLAHLGGIFTRGPGLTFVEATAVQPEGRITPEDSGIYLDSHVDEPFGLKAIVDFAHSQGQKIGIQLAHAGRKASTVAPWLSSGDVATKELNGWPDEVYAPSAIPYDDRYAAPKEMTLADIEEFKSAWKAAVSRALRAGFDTIEIHNAHGYLLHNFLSPASNKRTDQYGGSFENRVRLTLEVVELTRKAIPDDMPLFLRLSATDWLDVSDKYDGESWTVQDSIKLAHLLADRGVDVLDVSSGGNHPAQKIKPGPGYQTAFAKEIKKSLVAKGKELLVTTVGTINSGKQAEAIISGKGASEDTHGEQELDLVMSGRWFQKNPALVWTWAEELGVEINVANQIRWGFGGRKGKVTEKHSEKGFKQEVGQ